MSKIFEGLQRTTADSAGVLVERLAQAARAASPPAVSPPSERGPSPGPEPAAPPAAKPAAALHVRRNGSRGSGEAPPPPAPEEIGPIPLAARFSRTVSAHLAAGTRSVVVGADPRSSEQYRIIRTKVVQHPAQPRRIVISSAGSGDGKTVTSGNLAWTLALRTGASVLLVDGDFRHSSIADLYGIPPEPGLADILAGASKPEDAIVRIEQVPSLCVLPCGKVRSNPAELLDSARWKTLAAEFGEWFRFTIFDAPPAGAVADYDLIQAVSDGVILVVRPDFSARRACLKAIDSTPKERLLGIVLNHVQDWFLWKSPNAYYYAAGKVRRRGSR